AFRSECKSLVVVKAELREPEHVFADALQRIVVVPLNQHGEFAAAFHHVEHVVIPSILAEKRLEVSRRWSRLRKAFFAENISTGLDSLFTWTKPRTVTVQVIGDEVLALLPQFQAGATTHPGEIELVLTRSQLDGLVAISVTALQCLRFLLGQRL